MSDPVANRVESDIGQVMSDSFLQLESLMRDCHEVQVDTNTQLHIIADILIPWLQTKDTEEMVPFIANVPWTLDKHGREYTYLFTANAISNITVKTKGLLATINFAAGWNILVEPNGVEYIPPAGFTQALVLVRYTNWRQF